MAQNLLPLMCTYSAVVLSYFDAGLEPRCPRKEFLLACLLLLLAALLLLLLKCVAHPGPQEGFQNLDRVNPAR